MEQQTPSYYGILPASVRYDKKIPARAGYLYTEITALSNKWGYCTASNAWFAKLYEVDTSTISRWVSCLEKRGHIAVVLTNSETGTERKIYPRMDVAGVLKNEVGGTQKQGGGVLKNEYHSNTSINTKTTFLGKIENSKTENIGIILDENHESLQPFPENMPYGNGLKRAQEALNAYYAQDGKLDELRLEVGYEITSLFLDEQKKSFLEKMTNYAHNRARTFSEFKGYFVSWVRRGYEKSVKEETQKKQIIPSVQAEITADEISVAAAEVLGQVQRTPATAKRLDAIKASTPEQILENLKPVLELVNTWKDALFPRYKPLTAKQLIWIELNHPNKTKVTDALLKVVKYHPASDMLIDAIKIQLLK